MSNSLPSFKFLDGYSVEIEKIDEELEASPECSLPPDIELPPLPELPSLPALECQVDIEQPPIPTPYICIPEFSGTVFVTTGETTSGMLQLVKDGPCSATLTGNIVISSATNSPIDSVSASGIGATTACDYDGEDFPHLSLDSETKELSLGGTFIAPCFDCAEPATLSEDVRKFHFTDIDLHRVGVNLIDFNNRCAENDFAQWSQGGSYLAVGYNSGQSIIVDTSSGNPSINLQNGSDYINIDTSYLSGHSMYIREVAVCVDGENKKMLILASEPYE